MTKRRCMRTSVGLECKRFETGLVLGRTLAGSLVDQAETSESTELVIGAASKNGASSPGLAPVTGPAQGLEVGHLAPSALNKRNDVIHRQVGRCSALGAERLLCELRLPELLPRTTVSTLCGGASALALLPLVLAQTPAAAATAVAGTAGSGHRIRCRDGVARHSRRRSGLCELGHREQSGEVASLFFISLQPIEQIGRFAKERARWGGCNPLLATDTLGTDSS